MFFICDVLLVIFHCALNLLVVSLADLCATFQDANGVVKLVHVPDELVKTWYHNALHGQRFRVLVDNVTDEFGSLQQLKQQEAKTPTSASKRPAAQSPAPASAKKFKLDPARHLRAVDDPMGDELKQVLLGFACMLFVSDDDEDDGVVHVALV
jgi:hypothetical protein